MELRAFPVIKVERKYTVSKFWSENRRSAGFLIERARYYCDGVKSERTGSKVGARVDAD